MKRDNDRWDIRLLFAFEAMANERNVTRAAERLGLTQQGMSGQLARLRELFGDPLFVRTRNGMVPTPRAEELVPVVSATLSNISRLLSAERFDPSGFEGTARIAASDYAAALILPPLLRRIQVEAPGMRLEIRPVDAGSLEADMREARLDLALTVPQFSFPGLHSMHLFDERYVGVARRGHPMLNGGPVSLDDFCAYEHLLVSPFRGDAVGPTDEALARLNRSRRIGVVVPGFSVVGLLLEQTDLIALMPMRLIQNMRRDLETFRPPVAVEGFRLNAYWPPRLNEDPPHRWLREAIRAAAADCTAPDDVLRDHHRTGTGHA
ncbi:MAG: LysR family transcriptional regulator [Minwuia sp.]|uniref:LysR family transcriptional regulator n=1 Tax=Minwuia sp. TaxID=2493630 RepID=UPI003A86E518